MVFGGFGVRGEDYGWNFQQFESDMLYCPRCGGPMPVRKRLLLVLLDRETYDYVCAGCGTPLGQKEEPIRPSAQRP